MKDSSQSAFEIAYYQDFIAPSLLEREVNAFESIAKDGKLKIKPRLRARFPKIETTQALEFVCSIYDKNKNHLNKVLKQRQIDREFIDRTVLALRGENEEKGYDYLSPEYKTIIGKKDEKGRIIVGQKESSCPADWQVEIPDFLQGEQVTLFGPPDTKKMTINAMNCLHRKLPGEPPIVSKLVENSGQTPKWGADNEDSKTPLMEDFLLACENLIECFSGKISFYDEEKGKSYDLNKGVLAHPIKRFPGLGIPDLAHIYNGGPLPLHIYDFTMHLFHNWHNPKALCFYVPKLENEEEAHYIKSLILSTEESIREMHPEYKIGTVKLYIVFEGPRAIFRIREMAKNLHPYFVAGSLGWHDFLAATARIFKNDPNYRIPVKADPNIVINHIKESHRILADELGPIGGIKLGGMYGVLYENGNEESFQLSMIGYFKDVITQLKRNLDGFWVAHPDFVRIGVAIVEAFKKKKQNSGDSSLKELITSLIKDPEDQRQLLEFIEGPDVQGLDKNHFLYPRGVLAASLAESDVIANNDPEEVRYNIFQALQYLADWLRGNGCVALPATLRNKKGDEVVIRVMDDLATTERSRWEVWAEIHHGRFSKEDFEKVLQEEIDFIKNDKSTESKMVQVKWNDETKKWYPIAIKILRKLMTDTNPVEFVPQLLMPFLLDWVRKENDPWQAVQKHLCP